MIQVARARLRGLGEGHGFALEIAFDTDFTDEQFEAFIDTLNVHLDEFALVNMAARIAERTVEIDTTDTCSCDGLGLVRDVRRGLRAAGCDGSSLADRPTA